MIWSNSRKRPRSSSQAPTTPQARGRALSCSAARRITGLMRMMGKLAPEDRPMTGKRANEMRQLIEDMLDERTTEMKAAALKHALEHEAVDITLPGIRPQIGHQHLIKQIIEEAEDIFSGIGYTVESGPMVDTS
ncbi:MAG: hypothetical protein ACLU0O_06815 [Collinsella sp.]